jgi:hypothetical protein
MMLLLPSFFVIAIAASFVVGSEANDVSARFRSLVAKHGKEIETAEATDRHLRVEEVSQFKFVQFWSYGRPTCATKRLTDVGVTAMNKCLDYDRDTKNQKYAQFTVVAKGKDRIMTINYFLDNKCMKKSPKKSEILNLGPDDHCEADGDEYSYKTRAINTIPSHFVDNRPGVAEIRYSDKNLCSGNNLQTISALLWTPLGSCTLGDTAENYYAWTGCDANHAWGKLYEDDSALECKGPVLGNKEMKQKSSCKSADIDNTWSNYKCM